MPVPQREYIDSLQQSVNEGLLTYKDIAALQLRWERTQAPVTLPETPYERHILPRHYIARIRVYWRRRHGSPVARALLRYYIKQERGRR